MEKLTDDYYEFIGVKRDVTNKEIKDACNELLMKYHPDKCKDVWADGITKRIFEIKETLLDAEKREVYNKTLPEEKERKTREEEEPKRKSDEQAKKQPGKKLFCDYCGKDVLTFTCYKCGSKYCEDHQLPENHDCPYAPYRSPSAEERDSEIGITKHKRQKLVVLMIILLASVGALILISGNQEIQKVFSQSFSQTPTSSQEIVSSKTYAYIANFNSSTVSVIDTATNYTTATIDFKPGLWNNGRIPLAVAVTPDKKKVYLATCQAFPSVSVIDTATNKITSTLDIVGEIPTAVAVTPDGKKVYVACIHGTIYVIDTETNNITATVNIGGSLESIAITPDGKSVYVGNSDFEYQNISVIDTATNNVKATVKIGRGLVRTVSHNGVTVAEGEGFGGIAVSPDGKKVYTTVYVGSSDLGNVATIDTATNQVTAIVQVGISPHGIAITPDGKKVYVANSGSNTVSIIDTSANSIADTVNVESNPKEVAVTPDGKKAYVTNENSNTVSVIDTATNSVISTVPVGQQPRGIAIG